MFKKIFSAIFVSIIFIFLLINIWQNRVSVLSIPWNFNLITVTLLILSLIGVFVSSTISWHLLTLSMGINVPFKVNFKIWMISNISRLVPGTIWQYLSRVYLLEKIGISKDQSVIVIVLESILNITAASILFFVTLPFWQLPETLKMYQGWLWGFLIPPLFLFLLTNKKFINMIFSIMLKITGKNIAIKNISVIPLKLLIPLTIAFATRFITTGLVLFCILLITESIPQNAWVVIIGIFSFSWIAGYLSILSPGGLGVVEISLATLLSAYIPFTLGAAIAIVFRLLLLAGEALFLLLALSLGNAISRNNK